MNNIYKASGMVKCSLKKPDSDQNWWMVLDDIDEDLGKFCRNLYWLEHNKGQKLAKPYWGTHITIVRNEIPPNLYLWWKYHDEKIIFQYTPGVNDNYGDDRYRSFYWLNVTCPRFDEIRDELGLPSNPDRTYHVTVGSIENEQNRHVYDKMWNKK